MIAIADNYGDLSKYTSESKSEIRAYMTDETRKKQKHLPINYQILKKYGIIEM